MMCFFGTEMFFLAVPAVFRPTAELVKRDMQMLFAFSFLLSNMGLLTNYTELFHDITVFELQHSVYVDLLLALGGVIFFHYWEKIPEGVDLDRLVLRKMRKGYQFTLKLAGMVFAGTILGGDSFNSLPDGIFYDLVKSFAIPLAEETRRLESGFVQCLKMGGCVWLLLFVFTVLLMGKMRRKHSFGKPQTSIFIIVTMIFFLQCLFWTPFMNVLPVYTMMMTLAAFYEEKSDKISAVMINDLTGLYS